MPPAFIPSPSSNGFSLGPVFFHAYGIACVCAVAAAIVISRWGWRRQGGDPDLIYEVAMWGVPAGLIGGRIYFDITTPSQVPDHWWGVLAIWQGGLGIWGGIAAGAAAGLWVLNRRLSRADIRRFTDLAAPSLLDRPRQPDRATYYAHRQPPGPASHQRIGRVDAATESRSFDTTTGCDSGLLLAGACTVLAFPGFVDILI